MELAGLEGATSSCAANRRPRSLQPWAKERLDVFAPCGGLQTGLHLLVGNDQECWGLLDLEPVREVGSLADLDAVDHEGSVVAVSLKHLGEKPLRAT